MATINVTKTSGEQEPFSEAKLRRMLLATSADPKVVKQIVNSIKEKLYDGISTQRITEEAFRQLSKKSENLGFMIPQPEHISSPGVDDKRIGMLQRHAFDYFLHEINPRNGLVADNSQMGAPASIASVGCVAPGIL